MQRTKVGYADDAVLATNARRARASCNIPISVQIHDAAASGFRVEY